jgi:hypothetical protein
MEKHGHTMANVFGHALRIYLHTFSMQPSIRNAAKLPHDFAFISRTTKTRADKTCRMHPGLLYQTACHLKTNTSRAISHKVCEKMQRILFLQKKIFFFQQKQIFFFFFLKEMIFDDFRFSHVEKLDCLLLRLPDGVLRSL